MKRFYLHRDIDDSGISGVGCVAEGIQFSDGRCAMRWKSDRSSIAIYSSIADVDVIHGHNGSTTIVWEDHA